MWPWVAVAGLLGALVLVVALIGGLILYSSDVSSSTATSSESEEDTGSDPIIDDLSGETCAMLADETVEMSHDHPAEDETPLASLRDARVVTDHTQTYEIPSDASYALVLRCRGTAKWEDGESGRLRMDLTIRSDGMSWVEWQEVD